MSRVHDLKTHPAPFDEVKAGRKRFEFRKDDRGFEVGDVLRLKEFLPEGHGFPHLPEGFTGREVLADVLYILRGPRAPPVNATRNFTEVGPYGVPEGYAILSIRVLE